MGQILSYHDFVRVIFQTAFVTVYFIFNSLQQYGRRNSLRFHNVPMNPDNIQGTDGLVLKVCKDHLGVELKIDDIDFVYSATSDEVVDILLNINNCF
jgi:hypothetical protein